MVSPMLSFKSLAIPAPKMTGLVKVSSSKTEVLQVIKRSKEITSFSFLESIPSTKAGLKLVS